MDSSRHLRESTRERDLSTCDQLDVPGHCRGPAPQREATDRLHRNVIASLERNAPKSAGGNGFVHRKIALVIHRHQRDIVIRAGNTCTRTHQRIPNSHGTKGADIDGTGHTRCRFIDGQSTKVHDPRTVGHVLQEQVVNVGVDGVVDRPDTGRIDYLKSRGRDVDVRSVGVVDRAFGVKGYTFIRAAADVSRALGYDCSKPDFACGRGGGQQYIASVSTARDKLVDDKVAGIDFDGNVGVIPGALVVIGFGPEHGHIAAAVHGDGDVRVIAVGGGD